MGISMLGKWTPNPSFLSLSHTHHLVAIVRLSALYKIALVHGIHHYGIEVTRSNMWVSAYFIAFLLNVKYITSKFGFYIIPAPHKACVIKGNIGRLFFSTLYGTTPYCFV